MISAVGSIEPALLAARGIDKSFGEVQVLYSIDFDIREGEVHSVVGENGAGKSTLMKILSGLEQPTGGTLSMDGAPVVLPPNGQAVDLGIVVIHQELNLAEHLNVTQSIFLGRELTRYGFLQRAKMRSETRKILDLLHVNLNPDALISSLSVADKQMVEIAKAISRDARVLIMDEPTAVLSSIESDILFAQVKRLSAKGVGIVFISHKLDEVKRLSDRITILRDGILIDTLPASELSTDDMARLMVGRELSNLYPEKPNVAANAEIILSVMGLEAEGISDISFKLRKGEVLGFAGLIGSGRTAILESVVGLMEHQAEQIVLDGKLVDFKSVGEAKDAGIVYMTKDRKGKGLLLEKGLRENLTLFTLEKHVKGGFLQHGSEKKALANAIKRFDVRVRDPRINVGQLSGGNQQKLLLGKIMEVEPHVFIIDEPTRGIDVGTKQQIYHLIAELAEAGVSVIVISSEMQELIGLCHRVIVMRDGHMAGTLEGEHINEHEIVRYAAGLKGGKANERKSA